MMIDGLVVCVNYADLLALSLNRWLGALDTVTIVTSRRDLDTRDLVEAARWRQKRDRVLVHLTETFYADGADFNKGAAMQEAINQTLRWEDWNLLFDADIIPPIDLRRRLYEAGLQPGYLYGGVRHLAPGPETADRDPEAFPIVTGRGQRIPGCFQLFHVSDPRVTDRDHLLDVTWKHAGNYDSLFMARWPRERQIVLDTVHYLHLGEPGLNWHGRCSPEEGKRRKAERDKLRRDLGSLNHEHIGGD